MHHAMAVAVAEHDGFAKHHDGAAGLLFEEATDGGIVVHYEIVGGVALGAVDLLLEGAMEGGVGELADGVVAGADGGDDERHEVKGTRGADRSFYVLPVIGLSTE